MTLKLARWLALLIAALIPLYYWKLTILDIPTNIIELLVILSFVLSLFAAYGEKQSIPRWMILATLLILAGALIGLTQSVDLRSALGVLKSWILIPIIYAWTVFKLHDSKFLSNLVYCIVLSALAVSIYTVLQWFGVIPLIAHQLEGGNLEQYVSQGRALAFFESPNYLAMFLAPLIPVVGIFAWSKTKKYTITTLAVLLPVIALILSGSRAGMLGVVCAGLIVMFQRNVRIGLLIIGLLLVATFGWFSVSSTRDSGDASRLFIWRGSVELLSESPAIGIGLSSFQRRMDDKYFDDNKYKDNIQDYALHPHNIFMFAWLSLGIAGLFGLIILLVYSFRLLLTDTKLNLYQSGAIAGITAIVVHGLFDTTLFKNDLAIIFWLLIVLLHFSSSIGQNVQDD